MNKEKREWLRDAIEAWSESSDASTRALMALSLSEALRPILRIPGAALGIPDDLFAIIPMMVDALGGLPQSLVCVTINDPDDATQEKIEVVQTLAGDPSSDQDELFRLCVEVEPYVIIVPWDLYRSASDSIVTKWVYAIGGG